MLIKATLVTKNNHSFRQSQDGNKCNPYFTVFYQSYLMCLMIFIDIYTFSSKQAALINKHKNHNYAEITMYHFIQ